VVDDDPDTAEITAVMLRLWGHEVQTATDGPTALRLARGYRPQVILLDLGLPGMDGCEVARRVRREVEGVVLVALTGFGDPEHLQRVRDAQFDHFLLKPADPEVLRTWLAGTAV